MKKLFLLIPVLFFCLQLQAQVFKRAPEDKSLVYIVRVDGLGKWINFKYFDGNNFIGIFSGKGYMVYECDPGEHIIWAVSENTDYVIALLEAGKTYVIEANPMMGGIKAQVELLPLTVEHEKYMAKAIKTIQKEKETVMTKEEIEERNIKYKDYMETKLFEFEEQVDKNVPFNRITAEHALPEEYLLPE